MQTEKDTRKVLNKIKGDYGEILAVNFLKKQKYKILETNYKNRIAEIDIIALKDKKIVFVEVKRRATCQYGRPVEAVDFKKQQKIKKMAEYYLMTHNNNFADVRFDVVEIIDEEIFLFENAFD